MAHWIGKSIDLAHLPVVLLMVFLPKLWVPGPYYLLAPAFVALSQMTFMGCPLTAISYKLRRDRVGPFEPFIGQLYQKYGRSFGFVAILILTFVAYITGNMLEGVL